MLSKQVLKQILELKPFYKSNCIDKIFSWKELETLINIRPLVNSKRLHINNNKNYRWEKQAWLSDVNSWPSNLLQQELKSYSAYLTDMSKANKKINNICKQLEKNFTLPTDAHIYFSVVEKNIELSGFPPHWDWSHNLIIQIEGTSKHKIWDLYALGNEKRFQDNIESPPIIDCILSPGDIIFIPKLMYHQVISITKRISISFPINYCGGESIQDRTWISL